MKKILKALEVRSNELDIEHIRIDMFLDWSGEIMFGSEILFAFNSKKQLKQWLKPPVEIKTTRENLIKAMGVINKNHPRYSRSNVIQEADLIISTLKELKS
jgi:hypothetical protein